MKQKEYTKSSMKYINKPNYKDDKKLCETKVFKYVYASIYLSIYLSIYRNIKIYPYKNEI